jgi:hypothetical protein
MSPYFKDLRNSGALDEITIVADAPRSKAQIGEDVIFYNLSELNFMNYDTAWGKLNDALTRFASRFKHMVDFFGHVIIDTSAQGDDSISDYFDSVADQKFPGQVMQFRTCQWEAKEALYHYSRHEHFKVYKGDSVHQPFIVSETRPIMADMDLDRFIEVPIDFRPEFESDIYQALQDLAGVSTNSTDRFFPNPENLLKCFKLPMYSRDVIKIDFNDPSDKLIYHLNRYLQDIPTDRILYIHYDIGVTGDNTGLAITYFDHWNYYDRVDEKGRRFKLPYFKVPVAIGINRYQGQETPIYKLEEFIFDISKNYEIGYFSADQFASRQLLQDLEREKIKNRYLSVDRSTEPYIFLKSQSNLGLVEYPMNEVLKGEVSDLRQSGAKIDHTATGSKDISDAVCGSLYSCYLDLDNACKLSNKYKIDIYSESLKQRSESPMDVFQQMAQGIFGNH